MWKNGQYHSERIVEKSPGNFCTNVPVPHYRCYVEIDPKYFRPTEVDVLLGDSTKARKALRWEPRVSFDQLIDMMVKANLDLARREDTLRNAGYECTNNSRNL